MYDISLHLFAAIGVLATAYFAVSHWKGSAIYKKMNRIEDSNDDCSDSTLFDMMANIDRFKFKLDSGLKTKMSIMDGYAVNLVLAKELEATVLFLTEQLHIMAHAFPLPFKVRMAIYLNSVAVVRDYDLAKEKLIKKFTMRQPKREVRQMPPDELLKFNKLLSEWKEILFPAKKG